jgi:DNA repair exonuclease SbcCD nuclease subunit
MKSEKKNVRIAHFADIHWRGLTRHKEYREVFSKIFEMLREQKPDIIYIGGDIVHSKTQGISPELIDALVWMFTGFANIAPTEVILGNHDGILLNKDRQDTITPIITALSHPNIKLYKESGTYPIGIPGFSWNVFSCFDEDNWSKVRPKPGDINIALFHGGVLGSTTDIDWHIEGEVDVNFFERFDFALLGDIHKVQFLNPKKTVAYCGSTVQQNYGEDTNKGYLLWDIRDKDDFDVNFHKVEGPKPFVTVNWEGNVQKTLKAL